MQNKNANENIKGLEVKKELLKPKIDVVFQSLFNQKNEEITKEIEKMETIWSLKEKSNEKLVLTDKIELRIIELKKAKNTYNKNKENRKAQWMMFLNDPNAKGVQNIMEKNKEIKKATVEVVKMTEDEKMERLAFLRWKAIMDEKDIYAAGLDKGVKQEKLEIAKKLLKMKMSIEDIVKATGLSKKEIEEIKK